MSDREKTTHDGSDESAEQRRSRSAREVTEWETAFAAATTQDRRPPAADADSANAGAIVSRAHRAEKISGGPGNVARPEDWPVEGAE